MIFGVMLAEDLVDAQELELRQTYDSFSVQEPHTSGRRTSPSELTAERRCRRSSLQERSRRHPQKGPAGRARSSGQEGSEKGPLPCRARSTSLSKVFTGDAGRAHADQGSPAPRIVLYTGAGTPVQQRCQKEDEVDQ